MPTPMSIPYSVAKYSGKAKVTQTYRVSFSIGSYANSVDCDVVPMQACSLLLVILGNMIMMLHTMVEVINTLLCIKKENYFGTFGPCSNCTS